jgi:hypothetical protein
VEGRQFRRAFLEHGLVHNGISAINGFRFVAGHFHRGGTRYAGPLQISNCGAPEIMRDAPGNAGTLACALPRCPRVFDSFPLAMEQPWNNLAGREFEISRALNPPAQDSAQFRREWKEPAFPVFRFARLKAQPAVFQVEMVTLARKQFGRDSPAGDVCGLGKRLEIIRQLLENRSELVLLEESAARVIFVQQRKLRPLSALDV